MTIIESGELPPRRSARRTASSAARSTSTSPGRPTRSVAVDARILPLSRSTPCAACGRAGGVEPGEAAAGVPVLRDGGAVYDRRGVGRAGRERSRQGAARASRRSARLAGREAHRPVPELQGRLGLRSGARRPELRVLRLAVARRLQGDQGADPAAEPAAVQGQRDARSASRSASGMRASGWRRAS